MTDRIELQKITVAKLREHSELLKHSIASWQLLGKAANEIERLQKDNADMLTALRECASRCRYDGDSHHDRADITRRDASWKAMEMAEAAIVKASLASTRGTEIMTDRTDYMAEQRLRALARRNEFWAEMMKAQGDWN